MTKKLMGNQDRQILKNFDFVIMEGREMKKMYTATIKMQNNGEIYTGGTGRGKTIERAIELADDRTSNNWNLWSWAEIDGNRIDYIRQYNTSTGKDEIIIL